MLFDEQLGADEMEFATPSEEQTEDLGEEEQDVTEPVSEGEEAEKHKNTPDAAFAEMRRAMQDAQKKQKEAEEALNAMRAEQKARQDALKKLGGSENAELEALADSLGIEVEDVIATLEAEQNSARLAQENNLLKEQIQKVETERQLDAAITTLNGIDPNLKDNEIVNVLEYVDKGLSVENAYYAVKAKEINTQATPAREIGQLNQSKPPEKDFYTEAEVDAMTPEQQRAHADTILKSMSRW